MGDRLGRVSGAFGGRRPTILVAAVAVGWFLVLGMRFVLPALLPTIRAEFGVSNAAAGFFDGASISWRA